MSAEEIVMRNKCWNSKILRHIPLKLASADIDDLHLHIFLGDADANVVAHRREVVKMIWNWAMSEPKSAGAVRVITE